ncbi:MAG: endonuclease/exonuclease/phosphatase family protein [Cyclobacteriaceae bacterium]|nr:endonuclease/exonuclease/phosphatase family protein [Cyclobacteriaceae bacterium]
MIIAGLTIAAMIIQIAYILPYSPLKKPEVPRYRGKSGNVFSAMVSNVLMKNRNCRDLIDLVKKNQPDLLLFVEPDHYWDNKLEILDQDYAYRVKYPLDNTYGMILFSKLPLKNIDIKFLYKEKIPSFHMDVVIGGLTFKLICLHPEPPAPNEADSSLPRDRELTMVANKVKKNPHHSYLVMGDLNDVAWSDTSYNFRKISGLKDPRVGRGFYNTYHAKIPFMRWALDHVFVTEDFKLIKIKRMPAVGSDHFPIHVQFGLKE